MNVRVGACIPPVNAMCAPRVSVTLDFANPAAPANTRIRRM